MAQQSKYLPKESIKSAFPTTKTSTLNKLFTENSITRLINKLIDTDKYVLTPGNSEIFLTDADGDLYISNYTNYNFEFVIHGYYFDIDSLENIINLFLNDTTNIGIWARITINTQVTGYPELSGQIAEDNPEVSAQEYAALEFVSTPPNGTTGEPEEPELPEDPESYQHFYNLLLLKKKPQGVGYTDWVVPASSLFKFNTKSIRNIDGGQLPNSPELSE